MKNIFGIACVDSGGAFAKINHGPLPWTAQQGDLDWFKFITNNNIVVVGANTYAELQKLPPLKNREIWPVGKNFDLKNEKDVLARYSNLQEDKQLFIAGGARLWISFQDYYSLFYLTMLKEKHVETSEAMILDFNSQLNDLTATCFLERPHYKTFMLRGKFALDKIEMDGNVAP